jgi:hypothetical protein
VDPVPSRPARWHRPYAPSFEAGARVPDEASAGRLRAALEEAGVIFTADGVKLSRNLRGGRVPEQLNAEKDG